VNAARDRGAAAPVEPVPGGRHGISSASSGQAALNVLVIGGGPDDRRAVRQALETCGAALQDAADAEHGVKLAHAAPFDCILINDLLPDALGLDVLESLRQPDGALPCAAIMLTQAGTADGAAAAVKAGALDYLATGDLDAEALRRAVRSAVRQFRLIDAQRMAERRNAELAAIVGASDDAIISVGIDLRVQTWNAGAQRLFGYGEAEARGRTVTDLIVPDAEMTGHTSIYAAAMRSATTVTRETLRRHKDGHLVPVDVTVSPILDGARITGFSAIIRDISERRRAEEVQARLAAIVTSSADAIISETLDGVVTSWNEAAERMFGYQAAEMIGQQAALLVPRGQRRQENLILDCMSRGECIEHYETTCLARNGRTFDASIGVSTLRDAEGRNIGASKIITDITERKRTEARLAEREAQLALFVEYAPAAIAMFDRNMICLAASRRFITDYQVPEGVQVVGVSHYEPFPEIPQRWRDIHSRVLAGEELSADEDSFVRPDGSTDWTRWTMKPWRTSDGHVGGALLFTEVITGQVEARLALAESEARFRATFENAAVGIAHSAPNGRWLRVNAALCRILGYQAEELLTRTFQEVTHPDDLAADLSQFEQMHDGKAGSFGIDKRYLRKDGTAVWCRRTVSCVRKSDGAIDYFVTVVEDITERKAHEEQVHMLMREVTHRAKNMLSLVHAIARQTAARAPEDFIARFTERIQALAANQDLLVRNEWRGVDVGDLARAQLAHFADLVGTRIVVRGPKLRLNAAAAQAIGLALHELATNAGKYGALSTNGGRVDVRWRAEGGHFTMCWTERGGPPVTPPQRQGFGSTVMTQLAERSVGGKVHLDYAPAGLSWRLTCRAAKVLEGWAEAADACGR
jgi:PAS domain S-box-containing protein